MRKIEVYVMGNMFKKNEMQNMESTLESFLSHYDIQLNPPIDIFELLNDIGFDVRGADFKATFDDSMDGMIIVNENLVRISQGFKTNKVIAYNIDRDIMEKKFIVAHEFAHYIEEKVNNFDTKIVVAARDRQGDYSGNTDEQRKDYIAAAILIPKDDLNSRFLSKKKRNIKEIAEFYNVASEMAERRVKEVESINEQ